MPATSRHHFGHEAFAVSDRQRGGCLRCRQLRSPFPQRLEVSELLLQAHAHILLVEVDLRAASAGEIAQLGIRPDLHHRLEAHLGATEALLLGYRPAATNLGLAANR